MARIQVVVDEREREAFRAQAAAEGRSPSEWMRVAAHERLERARPAGLRTAADLERFFTACVNASTDASRSGTSTSS